MSVALLGAVIGIAGGGCGGGTPQQEQTTQTKSPIWFEGPWGAWAVAQPDTEQLTGGIGACAIPNEGSVYVGRSASTNRIRIMVNKWRGYTSPAWADMGTVTQFASKPACTALDDNFIKYDPDHRTYSHQFAVVARANDNKIYARTMQADTTFPSSIPVVVEPSTTVTTWHTISSSSNYASAPSATVAFGKLLVVGRRSDNRLYLHRNTLGSVSSPYNQNNWSSTVLTVPALPAGWTAAGDPAIADVHPAVDAIIIVTRATKAGQPDTLFQIYWQGNGTGSYFWDSAGSQDTWQFLPTGSYVRSDPAIVADNYIQQGWVTVFVQGSQTATGTKNIYQGTGISWMWSPFDFIPNTAGVTLTADAPAAVVGDGERCYTAVARGTQGTTFVNQAFWSQPPTGQACPW